VSAALLSVLAIVFTGHGIKALQEAGVLDASPLGDFNLPALGIYATSQSLIAQALMVILVGAGYAWSRRTQRGDLRAHNP
jgi:high-affinity iron transporter